MATTLEEVERLAAELSAADRLLLRHRLSRSGDEQVSAAESDAAIARFQEVSARLRATTGPSMTEGLFDDRR